METYYLVPTNLIHKIQGDMGSIASFNSHLFDELASIAQQLGDNDIVLLSDTQIENLKCEL